MKIQVYERQVRPAGLPIVQAPQAPAAAFGSGLAEGIGEAGNALFRVAVETKERADNLAVMDAVRQFGDWQMDAIHGPQGALNTQGRDAVGLADRTHRDAVDQVKKIRDGLANSRQKDAFERLATQDLMSLGDALHRHEARQAIALHAAETDAALDNTIRLGSAPGLTMAERQKQLTRGIGMLDAAAMLNSWGPEARESAKGKYREKFHGTVLDQLALTDPDQASQYLGEYQPEIRPEDVKQFAGQVKASRVRHDSRQLADGIIAQFPDDIEKQRKAARQILDTDVFDATMKRLDDAWRDHEQEIKVGQDALLEVVQDEYDRKGYLDEHSPSFAKLKLPWANKARAYDKQQKAERRTQSADERRIQTEIDENIHADFILMSDEEQAKVNLKADYRGDVSPRGFLALVRSQNEAKARLEKEAAAVRKAGTVTGNEFRQMISLALTELRIQGSTDSQKVRRAKITDWIIQNREQWEADPKNKELVFDESRARAAIAKGLLLGDRGGLHLSPNKYKAELDPGEAWVPFEPGDQPYAPNKQPAPLPASTPGPPAQQTQTAAPMPPGIRQKLIDDYQALHPGSTPSEHEIRRAYAFGHQKGLWQ